MCPEGPSFLLFSYKLEEAVGGEGILSLRGYRTASL
jgi:hypothetical protein